MNISVSGKYNHFFSYKSIKMGFVVWAIVTGVGGLAAIVCAPILPFVGITALGSVAGSSAAVSTIFTACQAAAMLAPTP